MSVDGEFKRLTAKDRLCAAVLKAVRENDTAALRRLGLGGFAQYAGRLSELMTASVRGGLDWSPDFAALMRQVNSPVRYAHHLVNECGAAVQTALDERNGLRLRVVQPEYNDGRTKAIVGEAAESDSEHAADNLATQLGTEVKDAGNEFMKQNAEQRSSAGFKVTVERTGGTNCCPWCADRIGRWELKDAPKDVFGCHDNCTCMVDYTNSKGTVRGKVVTHKIDGKNVSKWEFADKIPYTPPRVLTREEAAAKGGFDKPKRLTGGANGGILNYRDSNDVYKPVAPEAYSRIKPLDVFGDQRDHQVAAAMRYVLDQVKGKEPGTEWLGLYDHLTMRLLDGVLSEIGAGEVRTLNHDSPYITIHNHASGETFSIGDIYNLSVDRNCRAIYVVGNNGNCYALFKTDNCDETGFYEKVMMRRLGFEPYTEPTEHEFIKECERYGVKYLKRVH